jgi:hypothetical protein
MHSTSNSNPAELPRCFVCGSDRDIEWHHIAGCHHPATVPLCVPHHREQTDRQRAAGLHNRLRSHADVELVALVAMIEGVTGLLAAHARYHRSDVLAGLIERNRRELTRTITLAAETTPGLLGPRPSTGRHRKARDNVRGPVGGRRGDADASLGDAAALFRTIVGMLDGFSCLLDILAADPQVIETGIGLIDAVGRLTDTIAAFNDGADSLAIEGTG